MCQKRVGYLLSLERQAFSWGISKTPSSSDLHGFVLALLSYLETWRGKAHGKRTCCCVSKSAWVLIGNGLVPHFYLFDLRATDGWMETYISQSTNWTMINLKFFSALRSYRLQDLSSFAFLACHLMISSSSKTFWSYMSFMKVPANFCISGYLLMKNWMID